MLPFCVIASIWAVAQGPWHTRPASSTYVHRVALVHQKRTDTTHAQQHAHQQRTRTHTPPVRVHAALVHARSRSNDKGEMMIKLMSCWMFAARRHNKESDDQAHWLLDVRSMEAQQRQGDDRAHELLDVRSMNNDKEGVDDQAHVLLSSARCFANRICHRVPIGRRSCDLWPAQRRLCNTMWKQRPTPLPHSMPGNAGG